MVMMLCSSSRMLSIRGQAFNWRETKISSFGLASCATLAALQSSFCDATGHDSGLVIVAYCKAHPATPYSRTTTLSSGSRPGRTAFSVI